MAKTPHPLQAMVDGMSAAWQKERAETQMTLGELIEALEGLDPETRVHGFGEPHSYRGYYKDLSFHPTDEDRSAAELLAVCRSCMGRVFTGYKGGEFMMGETTPVWLSPQGSTAGGRLMELREVDGMVEPVTEDEPPFNPTETDD